MAEQTEKRIIKFRGWSTVTKTILDLKAITPLAKSSTLVCDGLFLPFTEDIILMQYLGRKDKNGKEIYEGDILSYEGFEGKFIVKWGHWGWTFKGTIPEEDRDASRWPPVTMPSENFEFIEIIGNIHQNPELLENK